LPLILDEPTSALDPEDEVPIRRPITGLLGSFTALSIGHRNAVRDDADQVITVKNGPA
jgi:ABC-type transport system involved in cytochrome bd biosynthesis fused ATPase/permease subunit